MSSHQETSSSRDVDFIQELKSVGLTSEQIFQLLMKKEEVLIEKESTNQKKELNRLSPDQMFQLLMKKEELKILELEENSKRRNHDHAQSPLPECGKPSSTKKVFNQFPNRKSLHDLCTDELATIFDFIPNFGAFKLARVSKQFHEILLNNIKRVHLLNDQKEELDPYLLKDFVNSRYFHNIESLLMDFDLSLELVEEILNNSDNLRELKISVLYTSDDSGFLSLSQYPRSSFKKLEKLHIQCSDNRYVKLDHFNLFNLKELKISGYCKVSHYLTKRMNNIKKLHLSQIKCDVVLPKMKMLTDLTLIFCDLSEVSLYSLFVDTLEHVNIKYCKTIERNDGMKEDDFKPISAFPFLQTLNISNSEKLNFTTLFQSKLPSLTNLKFDDLTEPYAKIMIENTSITSLKKLSITNSDRITVKNDSLKILTESKPLFRAIESICITVKKPPDSNILLYISKNTSIISNLKKLRISNGCLPHSSIGLNGYQLFTSEHFNNLEKLTITLPNQMEDLNYLAQTTCFPNLKFLYIVGRTFLKILSIPPENFYSLFSSNSNFNQLSELGFTFLDDSSISSIKSMENLKTIYVSKDKNIVTGWGLKQLDEWGVNWLFIEDNF